MRRTGSAVDLSGNVLIAGAADGFDNALIAKYDAAGDQLWVRQFGHLLGWGCEAWAVAVDPSGNVFAAGIDAGGPLPGSPDTNVAFDNTFVDKIRRGREPALDSPNRPRRHLLGTGGSGRPVG